MAKELGDYRASRVGRRRSWYGLKRPLKRLLALRAPHAVLRAAVRVAPSLARDGRLPAPAALDEVVGHVQGATFVMLRPDRCVVAKELYWGGGRRPKPEDAFAVELFASRARAADAVFDIGAYTGLFTLVATSVNPMVRVFAFEIVPDVHRALMENCVRNEVLDRVTLHLAGVGVQNAVMRVPSAARESALPSFYSSRLHFDSGDLVPFRSLDSFEADEPPSSCVLMKIDVEGTEDQILRHGQRFLHTFRPDLLCEILVGVGAAHEVEDLLAPHGYRFYLVRDGTLQPAEHIRPDPAFRDWFFTTEDAEALRLEGIAVAD
jgi:FkbM family methyltransferase